MPPGRALSGKPTTVWDHDAHLTLLQAVIVRGEIKAECWDAIIAYTNLRGYNYTQGAALYAVLSLLLLLLFLPPILIELTFGGK